MTDFRAKNTFKSGRGYATEPGSSISHGFSKGVSKIAIALLVALGSLGVPNRETKAQLAPNIFFEPSTGFVELDNNAFDIETGDFGNTSEIPLPAGLPSQTSEGVSIPTTSETLAPNFLELVPDIEFIDESLMNVLTETDGREYQLQPDSVQITTQFNLERSVGNHNYGEGIQATVYGPDGDVLSQETVFVRGDTVEIGPDGEVLPESEQVTVSYGANDRVELRVLNLPENNAEPAESGIYFSEQGEFIVEDLLNGGDQDFNDGRYVQVSGGEGQGITSAALTETSFETVTEETPLDPEMRQEEVVETEVIETVQEFDEVLQEDREFGKVELPNFDTVRLGHARGARSDSGEQLVYDRYSATAEARLGSDGLSAAGQLAPLIKNPSAPPTLLSGELKFNPFLADNEAGLTTTVSITQFLNRTHRRATDIFGNPITTPDGPSLLEPTGFFNNRRWVNYVPATQDETVLGNQIRSQNGIFELPSDKAIAIAPSSPGPVGRGNAAYTNNVGGLLIEDTAGNITFAPQWTENGFRQESIVLEPGEARRVIYALVPQQAGQALQIGERYAVISEADGYRIAEGGFTVISADRQPQNFSQEAAEVYAVEDTLPRGNAATAMFNGIQGFYIEPDSNEPVPTVDITLPDEVDARVGNELFPISIVEGDEGQLAYARTTRAAGLYLGGALSTGIGNQRDTVTRTTATVERALDELQTTRTLNTFMTPLIQVDSVLLEETQTTQDRGVSFFDINAEGELVNAEFVSSGNLTTDTDAVAIDRDQTVVRGEEALVETTSSESTEVISSQDTEIDRETTTDRETRVNFAAVQGELALGGVLNFGNTPWSPAANTVRAELFARDTVLGRSSRESETGWRAEVIFHPFGEVTKEAYQYDSAGNVVPVYKTEPVMDGNQQLIEMLVADDGEAIALPVNRFALDESGDRIAQEVGTGRAKGPGVYVRLEDAFSDGNGALIAGGIQFAF